MDSNISPRETANAASLAGSTEVASTAAPSPSIVPAAPSSAAPHPVRRPSLFARLADLDEEDTRWNLVLFALLMAAVLGIFYGAVVIYLLLGIPQDVMRQTALQQARVLVGVPLAGAAAFGIVFLWRVVASKKLSVQMPGLKIEGSAAPAILWIVTFLAIVFSIKYLSP